MRRANWVSPNIVDKNIDMARPSSIALLAALYIAAYDQNVDSIDRASYPGASLLIASMTRSTKSLMVVSSAG
jgi:hypothetical protein